MPSPRSGVTVASTQANTVDFSHFVRVDLASPVGTQRFTDRWVDTSVDVGDGAGAQTWTSADVNLLNIDQNNTDILAPSGLDFANVNYTWQNWLMTLAGQPTPISMRGTPVSVYRVWFTASGSKDSVETLYVGTIDNQTYDVRAQIALKPFTALWARDTPWQTFVQLDAMWGTLMPDLTTPIIWDGVATPPQPSSTGTVPAAPTQTGYLGFTGDYTGSRQRVVPHP